MLSGWTLPGAVALVAAAIGRLLVHARGLISRIRSELRSSAARLSGR